MELKELALRIRRGDREALKTLISEYGVGVYQKAYRKTQDKVLAREATRQTFAQLVTALQEQTDMDGWELWLNALAKRNIETYSNIGSDMAYLENQLNRELFPAAESTASGPASQFALQQQQEAQEAQRKIQQQQYEMQQAQLRLQQQQQQYEAQQAQLRLQQQQQYEAQQAQLRLQQQQQYEAQQAQLRLQQYEAQLAAQRPAPAPAAQQTPITPADQPAAQPPETPVNAIVEAAPELPERLIDQKRRRKARRAAARLSEGETQPIGSAWPVVVLLALLCLVLVWLVLGVVMSFGWLPKVDFGYEWFNEHILDLF